MPAYNIIRKNDLATTRWSGGTTTQLAIFPAGASYAERDFTWRISSAVIDDEESSFTSLPGISRIIMPLDGTLHLEHKGIRNVTLRPFEQDSFMGGWDTASRGRVTDFNLMMNGCEGIIEVLTFPGSDGMAVTPPLCKTGYTHISEVFYSLADHAEIAMPNGTAILNNGDVLILPPYYSTEKREIIRIKLNLPSDTGRLIRVAVCHDIVSG